MEKGLSYTSTVVVSSENVAKNVGSGTLDVFATPAMLSLMENAAMNAVAGELPVGSTTVGTLLNVKHVRASKLGDIVKATATLVDIEGRKLTFNVVAVDSKGVIGEGKHERFVVDIERFLSKL